MIAWLRPRPRCGLWGNQGHGSQVLSARRAHELVQQGQSHRRVSLPSDKQHRPQPHGGHGAPDGYFLLVILPEDKLVGFERNVKVPKVHNGSLRQFWVE